MVKSDEANIDYKKGDMMSKVFEVEIKKMMNQTVRWRRYFHQYPELSNEEYQTADYLEKVIQSMDANLTVERPLPTTVTVCLKGKFPGKRIIFRADIDALPIEEQTDFSFKSVYQNRMHACGHDGHMAMLLGAARLLLDKKDEFGGTVYLALERGEEGTGNSKYLFAYLDKHGINPDSVFGIHLLATQKTGTFGISDGPMMAAAQAFDVTIEGKGGHGSRPDQSINPIDAFVAIYNYLESLRLAKVNPFTTLTYSVGMLQSGNVPNVIPQTLRFAGTSRFFDRELAGIPFHDTFKEKIEKLADAYDCTVHYNRYTKPFFAVVNDKDCAVFAREKFAKEFGEEAVIIPEPWMASESYSNYLQQWPGIFAFLGVENEEKGIGAAHHNHFFDIDEDVLAMGAAGAATYAFEFLNSDFMPAHRPYRGKFRELFLETGNSAEEIQSWYDELEV